MLFPSSGCRFEQVGDAVVTDSGTTVTLRLVHTGGSPATNARAYSGRWRTIGASQAFNRQLTLLATAAQENFTPGNGGLRTGGTLRPAAYVEPDGRPICASVEVQ